MEQQSPSMGATMEAYGSPPPTPALTRSGLAVWSLVCGILAIVLSAVCIGPLFAIPAVICGHMAYSRIGGSGGTMSGKGLALGGLITGYVSIAMIPFIAMLAAIAIPNFSKARAVAQQNACINNLRVLDVAKQQWALENKKADPETPTASDLATYLRNGQMPVCPAGGTYTINSLAQAPTCSVPGHQVRGP